MRDGIPPVCEAEFAPAAQLRGSPRDGAPPSCSIGSPGALAGASAWRVPEQLTQQAKALARLPMTCRSVAGSFTLGLHVVPPVPLALAPSQARRRWQRGLRPAVPPRRKSAAHTIKELVSTG